MAIDFVQEVDDLESYAKTFVLCPRQWETFAPPVDLKWHHLRFSSANRAQVPACPGVYAFVVRRRTSSFPRHGYVMYIGMTKRDGAGNLKTRYANYLSERKTVKRPKVHYLLNKWRDHLFFYYAEITDNTCDIAQVEQGLCDAIIPPCNINDFSAKVRRLVRAFMR
jgi:hypothetical protein